MRRSGQPDTVAVYRIPMRERLPVINVPVRETDVDLALDPQLVLDPCYANGRYDDLDYNAQLQLPLDPAAAAWAEELLRAAGRR